MKILFQRCSYNLLLSSYSTRRAAAKSSAYYYNYYYNFLSKNNYIIDNQHCGCRKFSNNPDHEQELIRLSKRMGELDICSRREADRWIEQGRVYVKGQKAELGQKVEPTETEIVITGISSNDSMPVQEIRHDAVVLNKPLGYVSGQAGHGHTPAIRLLTRENWWKQQPNNNDNNNNNNYNDDSGSNTNNWRLPISWDGYAPAGRLDLDSTGLLVFSHSGVLAKKLIGSTSRMEKEYIVHVEPALQVSRQEQKMGLYKLTPPNNNLRIITRGGSFLLDDPRPLLPCRAVWIQTGKILKITLREGRNHQIRRMCRELIGYHVTDLQRTKIGPIVLGDLPLGQWRPLSSHEIESILKTGEEKKNN